MVKAHAGMDGRGDPFAVAREGGIIQMMELGAVGVRLDLATVQVIKTHPFGGIIDHVELGIFLGQKPDHLAVRAPEWFPGIVYQLAPILAAAYT